MSYKKIANAFNTSPVGLFGLSQKITSLKDVKLTQLRSYFCNLKNVIKATVFSIVIADIFNCLYCLFQTLRLYNTE